MPVQNSNFKISAHRELAANLPQYLIPTIFDCYNVSKGAIYTRGIARKIFGYYPPKVKIQIFLEIVFCPKRKF